MPPYCATASTGDPKMTHGVSFRDLLGTQINKKTPKLTLQKTVTFGTAAKCLPGSYATFRGNPRCQAMTARWCCLERQIEKGGHNERYLGHDSEPKTSTCDKVSQNCTLAHLSKGGLLERTCAFYAQSMFVSVLSATGIRGPALRSVSE